MFFEDFDFSFQKNVFVKIKKRSKFIELQLGNCNFASKSTKFQLQFFIFVVLTKPQTASRRLRGKQTATIMITKRNQKNGKEMQMVQEGQKSMLFNIFLSDASQKIWQSLHLIFRFSSYSKMQKNVL